MRNLTTKETAAALRHELAARFPGCKISVTMARGTAYGWLHVNWNDGPTDEQVRRITEGYRSAGRDAWGSHLHREAPVTLASGEVVQANAEGINCQRRLTDAAAEYAAQITGHRGTLEVGDIIEGGDHAEWNVSAWPAEEPEALRLWLRDLDLTGVHL